MLENSSVDVVLAEDDLHEAELSLRVLRRHPLVRSVTHVRDGAALLDVIWDRQCSNGVIVETPTVILLNVKLPKIDGMEVLRQLKCRSGADRIPIILMISSRLEEDFLVGCQPSADGFLLKPVERDGFTRAVEGCLGRTMAEGPVALQDTWSVPYLAHTRFGINVDDQNG